MRIYISGKYDGKEENKKYIEAVIKKLVDGDNKKGINIPSYISPVHLFGFMYDSIPYIEGMELCFKELDKCDKIYVLHNWKESTGACMEVGFAMAKRISITFLPPLEKIDTRLY